MVGRLELVDRVALAWRTTGVEVIDGGAGGTGGCAGFAEAVIAGDSAQVGVARTDSIAVAEGAAVKVGDGLEAGMRVGGDWVTVGDAVEGDGENAAVGEAVAPATTVAVAVAGAVRVGVGQSAEEIPRDGTPTTVGFEREPTPVRSRRSLEFRSGVDTVGLTDAAMVVLGRTAEAVEPTVEEVVAGGVCGGLVGLAVGKGAPAVAVGGRTTVEVGAESALSNGAGGRSSPAARFAVDRRRLADSRMASRRRGGRHPLIVFSFPNPNSLSGADTIVGR